MNKFIITGFLYGDNVVATSEDGCIEICVCSSNFRFRRLNATEYKDRNANFCFRSKSWDIGREPLDWKEEYFKVVDKLLVIPNRREVIHA